jgi:cellulose 1,4-beta-cellobiosidase
MDLPPHPAGSRRPARTLAALGLAAALAAGVPAPAGAAVPARADNPYVGAAVYVNPEWSALAAAEPGGAAVADQPTAVWLDRIADIEGGAQGMGLRDHLDEALTQGADLVQLVLHDLPGRDCHRAGADGELAPDELDRYRTEFVDPIAAVLADPAYADLRVVAIVEPYALAALATHTTPSPIATPLCDTVRANGAYVRGIGHALARLGDLPGVHPYLDISHPGRLGWDDVTASAVRLLHEAATSGGAAVGDVHGFIANTADYAVLREPHFTVYDRIDGVPVRQSRWVDWRWTVDVESYAAEVRRQLVQRGFPAGAGLLVDTSRNGWGGPGRPTGPGPATSVDAYVDGGRLDRRPTPAAWCNQAGAGLGERPAAAPALGVDAYVWAKPPGESDGSPGPTTGPYDGECTPYPPPRRQPTGALPDAPPAGQWFPAHFRRLLANAWPPLSGSASAR